MRDLVIFRPAVLLLFCSTALIGPGTYYYQNRQTGRMLAQKDGSRDVPTTSVGAELAKVNETRDKNQKLLTAYEREQSQLRSEVIKRRKLYRDGQIPQAEVLEAEQSFVTMLRRIQNTRNLVAESDMVIAEATVKDELQRMPELAVNGSSESEKLVRFNGATPWSIKYVSNVEKFYSKTFGRNLPITAMGQTATHNQMRFDHRDAMDVGLNPDSVEGKALINHLRRSGIPFIAFRHAVPGASTGPHIHIGQPSHSK